MRNTATNAQAKSLIERATAKGWEAKEEPGFCTLISPMRFGSWVIIGIGYGKRFPRIKTTACFGGEVQPTKRGLHDASFQVSNF